MNEQAHERLPLARAQAGDGYRQAREAWDEIARLREANRALLGALEDIANHPHSSYSSVSQYDIGVVDGHRCAANIARAAIAKAGKPKAG